MVTYGKDDMVHIFTAHKEHIVEQQGEQGGSGNPMYMRYGALLPKTASLYKIGAMPGYA